MNDVHFTLGSGAQGLFRWAQETLNDQKSDARHSVYTRKQLEQAETHGPYWTAAMKSMKKMGYVHNHTRMYGG